MKASEQSPTRGGRRGVLLAALKTAQKQSGRVARSTMAALAAENGISAAEVYGVTTFYSFLSAKPLGRNVIKICKSLPCEMGEGRAVLQAISDEIGAGPGETTDDGRFSLELTNCIGACDQAPAMLVNDDLHGNLTPARVREILKSYG